MPSAYLQSSVLETSTATTPCVSSNSIRVFNRNVRGAAFKRFPDNEFFAREVFPEGLGPKVFEPTGFAREPLNQILMRHDLR